MKLKFEILPFISLLLISTLQLIESANEFPDTSSDAFDEEGLTTSELIRLRGYLAKDHYIFTKDSYILNLVEATNPIVNYNLIKSGKFGRKDSVLFIHGIHTSANDFIANSINVKPKDYSFLNASLLKLENLEKLLLNEPATNSIVFTSLNFGHRVWLLNRRGTIESRGHQRLKNDKVDKSIDVNEMQKIAKSLATEQISTRDGALISSISKALEFPIIDSLQRNFWNFSLDEQAKYDIPEVVDYILKRLNGDEKLSVVTHSAGGALILLSLSIHPNLNDKLYKIFLMAPSIHLGGQSPSLNPIYKLGNKIFTAYLGPHPPTTVLPLYSRFPTIFCRGLLAKIGSCQLIYSGLDGNNGAQMNVKAGMLSSTQDVCSSHEFAQLIQSFLKGRTHYFDYGSASKNIAMYNQTEPPVYNLSTITHPRITIFWGKTDSEVPSRAIDLLLTDLKVPVETRFFNESNVYMNHIAFMYHKNVSTLITIPLLTRIES